MPRRLVGGLELDQARHQRLGDELAAVCAEASAAHARTSIMKRSSARGSLTPGSRSTPRHTSTAKACVRPRWRARSRVEAAGHEEAKAQSARGRDVVPVHVIVRRPFAVEQEVRRGAERGPTRRRPECAPRGTPSPPACRREQHLVAVGRRFGAVELHQVDVGRERRLDHLVEWLSP